MTLAAVRAALTSATRSSSDAFVEVLDCETVTVLAALPTAVTLKTASAVSRPCVSVGTAWPDSSVVGEAPVVRTETVPADSEKNSNEPEMSVSLAVRSGFVSGTPSTCFWAVARAALKSATRSAKELFVLVSVAFTVTSHVSLPLVNVTVASVGSRPLLTGWPRPITIGPAGPMSNLTPKATFRSVVPDVAPLANVTAPNGAALKAIAGAARRFGTGWPLRMAVLVDVCVSVRRPSVPLKAYDDERSTVVEAGTLFTTWRAVAKAVLKSATSAAKVALFAAVSLATVTSYVVPPSLKRMAESSASWPGTAVEVLVANWIETVPLTAS